MLAKFIRRGIRVLLNYCCPRFLLILHLTLAESNLFYWMAFMPTYERINLPR